MERDSSDRRSQVDFSILILAVWKIQIFSVENPLDD